jgi:hypothetical protein
MPNLIQLANSGQKKTASTIITSTGVSDAGKVLETNSGGYLDGSFMPYEAYDSGNLTITLSSTTNLTLPFNLNSMATIDIILINVIAQFGFNPNDITRPAGTLLSYRGTIGSTAFSVIFGASVSLVRADTRVSANITAANWRAILRISQPK